ncbi:HpcH/HpaI aldolase/citrate lyase family protein [Tessaracoccus bendigoensis DSM 12906]|uniref:HpcH/HpaI aldolase/citrate lyase family protein n=1 Tax=Tessaracoccus bendigoensis DSM 12906 TaxID=1123357 RepID=A0A1M6K7L2_9ACTN|nr:aldolase/citrate lyase family protein [Tessaracoccus bendigoensis]SHJ54949.1 HpcH/HpaI aldolase/citrate lyase family protein [Tessaracoccus bendigoensis DSM 12906]
MTDAIEWMLITANPELARHAEASGVHRIFIDMEVNGKAERQGHLDTHKAAHTFDDISAVRSVLTSSELMVRVNPLHGETRREVDEALARGADRLMLPMFTTVDEVAAFRGLVPAGTPITYLAETPQALVRTEAWMRHLRLGDEVHYGLNDLSIAMGLDFLFEPLAADLLSEPARLLKAAGIPFGIGGIARPAGGELPASVVLGEHVRLGSSRLILSRAFHGSAKTVRELRARLDLPAEIAELRNIEERWRTGSADALAKNQRVLAGHCFRLAEARRNAA